jgi:hypothetical protein
MEQRPVGSASVMSASHCMSGIGGQPVFRTGSQTATGRVGSHAPPPSFVAGFAASGPFELATFPPSRLESDFGGDIELFAPPSVDASIVPRSLPGS